MRTAIWLDENKICTGGDDLTLRIINFNTTKIEQQIKDHKDIVRKIIHKSNMLFTCSDDKRIL